LKYRIVDLAWDYPGRITDWSKARNHFLDELGPGEWILWKAQDEELTLGLIKHLAGLNPTYPYYAIRRINLVHGRFQEWANPDFSPQLVSNRVRYVGRVHEHLVPRKPYGIIDYPIIHDQNGGRPYNSGWKATMAYRPVHAFKKALDVMKGR